MASTALAFVAVFAVLSALHHEAQGARMTANLTNTGQDFTSQSPLVPGLVTTEPTIYKLSELTLGILYKAKIVMSGGIMANGLESDKDFALQFEGNYLSLAFGHKSMQVTDLTGKELFKVWASRHRRLFGRFSYRILPPGSKDEKDSIFTINRDYFGRVDGVRNEEWRIYRGRKRDGHLAYYCVESSTFWDDTKCYNKDVRDLSKLTPVLKLHKKFGDATVFGGISNELPHGQYLTMQPGADAALFMAFGVILDTTHLAHRSDD